MSSTQILGVSIPDTKMAQVTKDFFFDGMVLPVDVYLKLRMDQYLLIGKQSEKCSFSNLHSYQNANSLVFVTKQDQPLLVENVSQFTEKVINQKAIPTNVKTKFILGLADNALKGLEKKGFTSVGELQRVSQMISNLTKNISHFDEVFEILKSLKDEDAKHAMGTCMVSMLIAEEMDITVKGALEKLALGALLHDIGMRFLPQELLSKPKHTWTLEENMLYESHPLKGVEMLRDMRDISNDVLLIVAEHHENAIGTGFPKRIRDIKISPLSRIVIVATYFTSLVFNRHEESKIYSAEEAINYMQDILGLPFNKQVFSSLRAIVAKTDLKEKIRA